MNTYPQPTKQGSILGGILIVDDSLEEAQVLSAILGKHGYTVRGATSGLQVLALAQLASPDLILLDIKILSMDGYEVCHQLKADEFTRHIPIIFLSSADDVFDSLTAWESVCVDCIRKPFKAEDVLAKVENLLAGQDCLSRKT